MNSIAQGTIQILLAVLWLVKMTLTAILLVLVISLVPFTATILATASLLDAATKSLKQRLQ